MTTATEQAETTCDDCGKTFPYTVATFKGVTVPPPPKCDDCEDADEEREAAEEREERVRKAFESRVDRAKLPKLLRGIEYPENTRETIRRWGAGEIQGLYLTGPYGVGKTHLAAAACWDRLHREPVRWVSVARLVMQSKLGFGEKEAAEAKSVVTAAGGIILDDIDKIAPTEYGREVLFTLVETRYQEGAPILVTANLTVGELGDRIGGEHGGSLASRLAGYCDLLQLTGDDRRLAA